MKMKVIPVTPEMAKRWLQSVSKNRKTGKNHVAKLALAMRRKEWVVNGESIKFSKDGKLLDGQHRLLAIIQSGMTVPMLVIRGLDSSYFDTMDQGMGRSLHHILTATGEKYACSMARALYGLAQLENFQASGNLHTALRARPSARTARAMLEANEKLREYVHIVSKSCVRFISHGTWAAFIYKCSSIDKKLAQKFWMGVLTGEGLVASDPDYRLREKLIFHRASLEKATREIVLLWCIKAWNAARKGETIKSWRIVKEDFSTPLK